MAGIIYSDGCDCVLQLHHYLHGEACSPTGSVIPSNGPLPLLYQHPFCNNTTTRQPGKNKHGGSWIQRISASIDTYLLMIKQQLRSSGGGFGPACMRTTVHIPLGAKRQICHCSFFRCSQTPQTFPLSWGKRDRTRTLQQTDYN